MNKKYDAEKIVSRINEAAKQYRKDIVGKTFLVLYEGHSIEILFKTENFLHLCGVDTILYAKDFYRKAANGQLSEKEIGFSNIHPYVFADIKTAKLSSALSLLKNESLVITEISTQTKEYKLGTTDLEVVICFDSQLDENGEPLNDILIPYSLRVEEIANSRFNEMYEVDYVLSKDTNAKEYTNIEFGNPALLSQYLIDNNITKYAINIQNNSDEEHEHIKTCTINNVQCDYSDDYENKCENIYEDDYEDDYENKNEHKNIIQCEIEDDYEMDL